MRFRSLKKASRIASSALRDLSYPLRKVLCPRRFHAFGIGAPKTGTNSLAGLFDHEYSAAHEPDVEDLIDRMEGFIHGSTSDAELGRIFRRRDRRLWLELEASHQTGFFLRILVAEFPAARFILTVRDCYTWVESIFGQQLQIPEGEEFAHWGRMRASYYRPDLHRHAPEERVLAERGLFTLDGYFEYWQKLNSNALSLVPPDRLLVTRTHEIERDAARIAEFVGVPASSLAASSHRNRARKKHGLLAQIDRGFVEAKVDLYCRPLMARFFPEIRSFDDAFPKQPPAP